MSRAGTIRVEMSEFTQRLNHVRSSNDSVGVSRVNFNTKTEYLMRILELNTKLHNLTIRYKTSLNSDLERFRSSGVSISNIDREMTRSW